VGTWKRSGTDRGVRLTSLFFVSISYQKSARDPIDSFIPFVLVLCTMAVWTVSEEFGDRCRHALTGAMMAKAKTKGAHKKQVSPDDFRHARLELPDEDYLRLKRVNKANGLSVTAYIRHTILRQLRMDEKEAGST
jgi:hypothetical protein